MESSNVENQNPQDQPLSTQPVVDVKGAWKEDASFRKETLPGDGLQQDDGFTGTPAAAPADTSEDWKDKVTDTFHDLKDKAGDIAEDIKDKAEDVWDDLKSGKLKEEAEEKLDDLKDGAKNLWNKITGKHDQPGEQAENSGLK